MGFKLTSAALLLASCSPSVRGFAMGGIRTASQSNNLRNDNTFAKVSLPLKPVQMHEMISKLQMSATVEDQNQEDPIEVLVEEVQSMNMDAIINTGAIVLIVVAVLNQLITVDSAMMRGWTGDEMAVRIPVDNWRSYSAILEKAPLFTKAVTSATVYTIGDFIAQRTEGKGMGDLDRARLIRSLLAGFIGHGPLSHLWYGFSEGVFENVMHLQGWWGTITKVAIDQTTWGPFWNNTYILLLGIMQMNKPEKIFSEMKRTTIPLVVSGLKLWPLAHLVTYGLIPVENRLLWVDLVEIIWVTILATAAANPESNVDAHGNPIEQEDEKAMA